MMSTVLDLRCDNVTLAYEENEVIRQLSLEIPSQKITALIGPNGSGKSTLLRGLARLMKPTHGAVYLDGQVIHQMPTKQLARRLAILPQRAEAPDGLLVRELVAFGRYPYQGFLGILGEEDDARIDAALELTGMQPLADRLLGELSGGQRQLAWLAMALAQDTQLLLLDEPTTFLDLSHQLEVLDVLERLHRKQQRTIVMVLHDINQAARYSQHMIALRDGKIAASGTPWEIVTPTMLADVFEIEAEIATAGSGKWPICIPIRRRDSSSVSR